jgi:hypothetical protein
VQIMFTNTAKQAKNTATSNAVQQFIANGGKVKTSKSGVRERKGTPANYFTSAEAPKPVEKLNTWETALLKLAALGNEHPGCINVQWGNDGRVANSVAEMYRL